MAKDFGTPVGSANVGYTQGSVIRMDENRSARFYSALSQLFNANYSLQNAASYFTNHGCSRDEIHPAATVQAFTERMDKILNLLHAMVEAEEHLNDDTKEKEDE